MNWKTTYTEKALKDLSNLPKKVGQRVFDKIEFFAKQSDPLVFAKNLKNSDFGHYRFRIGDYRAIFDIDEKGEIKILLILTIKHRKDVYKF